MRTRPFLVAFVPILVVSAGCSTGTPSVKPLVTTTIQRSVPRPPTTTVPLAGAASSATSIASVTAPSVPATDPSVGSPAPDVLPVQITSATTIAGRTVTNPSANVHLGDSGAAVSQIQKTLVAHGYQLPVTGHFGSITETDVKAFQTKSHLTPDGIVGPETWAKLSSATKTTTATTRKPISRVTPTTAVKTTTTTHH